MITDDRLKELMRQVGMPDSVSLVQALRQCDMEARLSERAACAAELADTQRALIEAAERRGYERGVTETRQDDSERKQDYKRCIERNRALRDRVERLLYGGHTMTCAQLARRLRRGERWIVRLDRDEG